MTFSIRRGSRIITLSLACCPDLGMTFSQQNVFGHCHSELRRRVRQCRHPISFYTDKPTFYVDLYGMIYTVYILRCADGTYYTGVTNDLDRRVWEHQSGHDSRAYTFRRRPLKLVFQEHFPDVNQAIAFEKQVKGWRRAKKEALIARRWDLLPELSIAYIRK